MERQGIKPANHARDNIKAIREQSQANKQKKVMEEQGKAPATKARPAPRPSLPDSTYDDYGNRDYVSENILQAASSRPRQAGEPLKVRGESSVSQRNS